MSLHHRHAHAVAPRRVIVLGANGFIGQALVNRLAADGVKTLCYSSQECNLLEPAAVKNFAATLQPDDTVVLASALTPDRGRDFATVVKNLRMVEHLVTALEKVRFSHLVYLSSDAVYQGDLPLTSESSPLAPTSFHGYMHLGRELALRQWADSSKVPLAILRPVAVYGAKDTHNSYGPNRFFRTCQEENKLQLFGQGEEKRDHLFIRDAVDLISLTLAHQSEGILNLASGKSASFFEVAEEIMRQVGGTTTIEFKPRSGPPSHSHFDITNRIKAFPHFDCIPWKNGIAAMAQDIRYSSR